MVGSPGVGAETPLGRAPLLPLVVKDATHVLVVGHSLNDDALVDALRQVEKTARIAIACPHPVADPKGFHSFEMEFGDELKTNENALSDWLG